MRWRLLPSLLLAQDWFLEVPYNEIVPGGGLAAHEAAGGHLIKKHVGRTEKQLAERLMKEIHVPIASTFPDRATAESAASKAIANNETKIRNFMNSTKDKTSITQTYPHPIGVSLIRGQTSTISAHKIHLILRKNQKMPDGYIILTGFPNP